MVRFIIEKTAELVQLIKEDFFLASFEILRSAESIELDKLIFIENIIFPPNLGLLLFTFPLDNKNNALANNALQLLIFYMSLNILYVIYMSLIVYYKLLLFILNEH